MFPVSFDVPSMVHTDVPSEVIFEVPPAISESNVPCPKQSMFTWIQQLSA